MSRADEPLAVLPGSLQTNRRLSQWLQVLPDGRVRLCSGKVEIGQGILHALARIAASELGVSLSRIESVAASTAFSPNEAVTSGSLSVQDSGRAVRHVCRQVRALFLQAVAQRFEVRSGDLQVQDGVFCHQGQPLCSYAEMADAVDLNRDASVLHEPTSTTPEASTVRHSESLTQGVRPDLVAKFLGDAAFIHDMCLPDMLYGRMVRPPNLQATLHDGAWQAAMARVQALPGVRGVYRDGCQLGLLAHTETQADHAAQQLMAALDQAQAWAIPEVLPDASRLSDWLRQSPLQTTTVHATGGDVPASVVRTLAADYARAYVQHASMAPSCALAQWQHGALVVWSHSQGIFNLRRDLALAFACAPEQVTVQHVQGAGCYGHNGADDVAYDAAWLAQFAEGASVRVMWSRHDEMAWSPLGPAMSVHLQAGLDAQQRVVFWQHDVWSQGHGTRPGRNATPALLGSWLLAKPFPVLLAENAAMTVGGGSERNAVPAYEFACQRVFNHRVMQMPQRVSALRALGAHVNVFAVESFMDELAHHLALDPLAFRLSYLHDARAHGVLQRVAQSARWSQRAQRQQDHAAQGAASAWGQGMGYARYKNTGAYCAVIAEVEVAEQVRLKRLYIAADMGQVVDAEGAIHQLEGGAIQAASWTLQEAAQFDRQRMLSVDWDSYPIMRFQDVPEVSVDLIDAADAPSMGAGEASLGPCAAAIGNAVFHALGVRVRDMPFTPAQILQAMDQADAA